MYAEKVVLLRLGVSETTRLLSDRRSGSHLTKGSYIIRIRFRLLKIIDYFHASWLLLNCCRRGGCVLSHLLLYHGCLKLNISSSRVPRRPNWQCALSTARYFFQSLTSFRTEWHSIRSKLFLRFPVWQRGRVLLIHGAPHVLLLGF